LSVMSATALEKTLAAPWMVSSDGGKLDVIRQCSSGRSATTAGAAGPVSPQAAATSPAPPVAAPATNLRREMCVTVLSPQIPSR